MNAPILRIEVERMTHCIRAMLDEHVFNANDAIKQALADFQKRCDEFITKEARKEIEAVVSEEVSNFFRFGNGRKAVKDAVEKLLDQRGDA